MARIAGSSYHHDARSDTHYIMIPFTGVIYEKLRAGWKVQGTLRLKEVESQVYELELIPE